MDSDQELQKAKKAFAINASSRSGRFLSPEDPVMDFWEAMQEYQEEFLDQLKKDNQVKIAEALVSQERFLNGYQKIMQRQFDYSVKEASTTLKKLVEDVNLENLKGLDDKHQQHLDELYGQFKQYQRILDRDRKIVTVFFVLNAISIATLLGLTFNLMTHY